jgi:TonB family protein
MNAAKDKGKGGSVGIVLVLVVLVLVGVGAALLLKRSMSRQPAEPVETKKAEESVAPSTKLVEAPPPLPEEPPVVEEVVEPEPEPEAESPKKPKKKGYAMGTIDKKGAASVTKKNFARVRACYEKQLKINNLLQGNISVKIVIYPDGSVNSVKLMKDTIRNQTMNACIKKEIKSWSFPKPEGGKAEVVVPYRFEPKAG